MRVYATFGLAVLTTEFKLRPWDQSDRWIDAPVDAEGYYPTTRPTRAIGAIPGVVESQSDEGEIAETRTDILAQLPDIEDPDVVDRGERKRRAS